ncbi:MAG TPA: methylated-DNA--[protein]-cysteine S-methyltransferase, partial [Leptolyngbyaceae cyanobacterium M65_K2018_010]|nr:methylated-DNA--[protein]-cysteine S-methyltransferase [Leptolyngbyaceae cyanobacterium M65_K2018_010]
MGSCYPENRYRMAEAKRRLEWMAVVGRSGPEQRPDPWVQLEAMPPGPGQAVGAGLEISYGLHSTPFGYSLIATTRRGICNLSFLDHREPALAELALRRAWPQAELILDQSRTQEICDRIFAGAAGERQPLVLWVKGSPFQLQVWRALLDIPGGSLTTYRRLAEALGRPTAARAVGNAVSQNPVGDL